MKGNYGAMKTDDPDTDGYYIVGWRSNVYTTQDILDYVYADEMVCESRHWNPASKAEYWYTPIPERKSETILRINQSLMVDIKLVEILENIKLPKGCNKKKAK